MDNQTIFCCVIALLLGMLLANMLKSVCGCKLVEGMTPGCSSCYNNYLENCDLGDSNCLDAYLYCSTPEKDACEEGEGCKNNLVNCVGAHGQSLNYCREQFDICRRG